MTHDERKTACSLTALFVLLFGSYFGWEWYKAGKQSKQYERQGIVLSQWDCFVGVKPAEQVIQIK